MIDTGATLNLVNANAVNLSSRPLENGGTLLYTGAGNLTLFATVITNRAGALFQV